MVKLCFYVPASHLEDVKNSVFAAGAGRVGNYDSCSWQVLGEGQFRPLAGSAPFLGEEGAVETVAEYRVEMVCAEQCIDAAVKAMIEVHPYEEPAWNVVALVTELPR
jgi:hypothetical protein